MSTQFKSESHYVSSAKVIDRTNSALDINTLEDVICTVHANTRIQQRGIKPAWVNLVLEYGHEQYQKGRGSYSFSLNKSSIRNIKRDYQNTFDIQKLRKIYVIVSDDDALITCAYR